VFGAGLKGHRFELTRHSNDEITLLEEQLGIRLPEEYAQVLTETGSGVLWPDFNSYDSVPYMQNGECHVRSSASRQM
jgi:hypothetical protein